jgi:hypothetical protein
MGTDAPVRKIIYVPERKETPRPLQLPPGTFEPMIPFTIPSKEPMRVSK